MKCLTCVNVFFHHWCCLKIKCFKVSLWINTCTTTVQALVSVLPVRPTPFKFGSMCAMSCQLSYKRLTKNNRGRPLNMWQSTNWTDETDWLISPCLWFHLSDLTFCGAMSLPGQLAAGTCEIVTLDRDSSQPRRTIARQTARCACKKGQIAGTTRARPACVDGKRRRSLRGGGHLSLNHPNVNAPFLIFFPEACLTPTLKLVLEHVKKNEV